MCSLRSRRWDSALILLSTATPLLIRLVTRRGSLLDQVVSRCSGNKGFEMLVRTTGTWSDGVWLEEGESLAYLSENRPTRKEEIVTLE